MKVEALGSKAAAITSILVLVGMVIGFLDVRHAKAAEYRELKHELTAMQRDRYEEKIEEIEDSISRLEAQEKLSDWEKLHLSQLRDRKQRYLRRLEGD